MRAALQARIAVVPDAKDVALTHGTASSSSLGVTGIMGHPGTVEAVAGSAVCLLVGTRLPLTARGGLDDALASTRTLSVGAAAPYVPCTHLHSDDLRVSLTQLHRALSDHGQWVRLRVPHRTAPDELVAPPFNGPGCATRRR